MFFFALLNSVGVKVLTLLLCLEQMFGIQAYGQFLAPRAKNSTLREELEVWQEGGPLPGPKSGLLSNTEKCPRSNSLSGRGAWMESSKVREPRRTHSRRFYGNGVSFPVVFGQSLSKGP